MIKKNQLQDFFNFFSINNNTKRKKRKMTIIISQQTYHCCYYKIAVEKQNCWANIKKNLLHRLIKYNNCHDSNIVLPT